MIVKNVYSNEVAVKLHWHKIRKEFYFYRAILRKDANYIQAAQEIAALCSGPVCKQNNSYFLLETKPLESARVFENFSYIHEIETVPEEIVVRLLLRYLVYKKAKEYGMDESIALVNGLYYVVKKSAKGMHLLRIDFKKEGESYYLIFSARGATKGEYLSLAQRKKSLPFNIDSGIVHRQKEQKGCYYLKSLQKITVPFFDWERFEECKVGILAKFFYETKRYLDEYIELELKNMPIDSFSTRKGTHIGKDIETLIEALGTINVINTTHLHETELKNYYPNATFSQTPQKNNILITYPKEHYQQERKKDPYITIKERYKECALQNITIDNLNKTAVKVALKELAIKRGVLDRKIARQFWIGKDLLFGMKKDGRRHYMRVEQSGALSFVTPHEVRWYDIRFAQESAQFMIADNQELIFIQESIKKPLPDIFALSEEYRKFQRTFGLSQEQKEVLAQEFANVYGKEFYEKLYEWITQNSLSGLTRKEKELFATFMLQKGYRVNTKGLRDKKGYLIFLKGIRVNEQNCYYAHTIANLKTKIVNAPVVRKLNFMPQWYFRLLEVGFVRTNDVTVLPFPFKYLREFVE